ncbi:hypothetical protein BU15DRAFT_60627 [Melanogaster broomeanus]|nr:hypothetical protein BU15DRAFT_60627 [Melanogaster broomeanus]
MHLHLKWTGGTENIQARLQMHERRRDARAGPKRADGAGDATNARAAPKIHRRGQNRQTGLVGLKANGSDQKQTGGCAGEAANARAAPKAHGWGQNCQTGLERLKTNGSDQK